MTADTDKRDDLTPAERRAIQVKRRPSHAPSRSLPISMVECK